MPPLSDTAILVAAGFLGGMLNALAGGGSFITLPALLFLGVAPVAANATGTAALLPGYLAGAWRFRRDWARPGGMGVAALVGLSCLGGCSGALLLTMTPNRLFTILVPWLIAFATVVFAAGPQLVRIGTPFSGQAALTATVPARPLLPALLLFAVCLYGGYFNGGLGILLLAAFSAMGMDNLHAMNGLKNAVSALLACIAVVLYALGGVLAYGHLLPLALAAMLGGYAGAALAYRIPAPVLRLGIVAAGAFLSLAFFLA